MNYFTQLHLPKFEDAFNSLQLLLESKTVDWGRQNQICLNSIESDPENYQLGSGSLVLDWNNAVQQSKNGSLKITPIKIKEPLKESDFNTLCKQFKGTIFEDIYTLITSKYKVGRVRLMQLQPKSCLTWHVDNTNRLHYPIKTQEGCMMVIENMIQHLPVNTWWITETKFKHTALNASTQSRIHLVCAILE